jgi:hypothetical protein
MKKFKITQGDRVYIVDAKSHIDAISKVKAVKTDEMRDSISQWNPGMSEIGLFQISYKRNGVYQSILVRANSEEQAKQKLLNNLNGVDIIGVNSHPSPHFHEPILDSKIKDDGYYYLLRDAIDLLTKPGAARSWSQPYLEEVQEYMVQKGINPTNVNQWKKKYESLTKDSSIKDINQVLLSNLKQVAQKGDAWWNKWKKLLDMSDKWNSYQWKELRNNDPKKYKLIINNKQYAEKEAEALNREWDRAIDALSRDRSFGRPGDYRMDLHSYKSRNDNYPMGNSRRYDEILYGYEQAEKSARAKKGLDSSIKDAWSGIRSNGVIFNYSNGKYTITHKNGKVETFPDNKFNTVEELFKYIDNIKDSAIKDEDYSKYLSIVKQLEKLVEPANRALQQKIAKYGVTKQDIRNNSPKYRDVCREIPELKVWAKLIMQLPGELAGFMPAHPSQESVDKLKKAITNSKAFDSTIK